MERTLLSAHDLHHTIHSPGLLGDVSNTLITEPNLTTMHSSHSLALDTSGAITEIRQDYLHEYYVLVAPKRANRPYDTLAREHPMVESASSPRLDQQTSVLDLNRHGEPTQDDTWSVKVVENKFPALTMDNSKAYGKQELVIDTPISNQSFGELESHQIELILQAYQQRSQALHALEHIKYVSIFRNDGYEAGASLAHAHSQIMGLPMIPPDIAREATAVSAYESDHKRNAYDAIIRFEQHDGSRIIAENDDWIAFCPYASRWQMEAWILPKQAGALLEDFTKAQFINLAPLLKQLAGRLTGADMSYNMIIEQGSTAAQRLTIKFCGRNVVSPWGGLEVGTGIIVNVIPPESAAKWYRAQSLN